MAEVYGPEYSQQIDIARQIRDEFKKTPGVVDVDWTVEDPQPQYRFVVDKEKAALAGVSADQIAQTLRLAVSGAVVGLAHHAQRERGRRLSWNFPAPTAAVSPAWRHSRGIDLGTPGADQRVDPR